MDARGRFVNLAPFGHCSCNRMRSGKAPTLCAGRYVFMEEGKATRFTPRRQEEVEAVVLDDCVFQDKELRCDGLFLWRQARRGGQKIAALVELKGSGDLPHAFAQLAHVQKNRRHYQQLLDVLNDEPGGHAREKAVIVTNGQLKKTDQERLEREHGIRVAVVQHREPTRPIPDLREQLF